MGISVVLTYALKLLVVLLVVASAGLFIAGALGLYGALGIREAVVSPLVNNTDPVAVKKTISILSLAEKKIEMFDDGDSEYESIYNDPGFLAEVGKKLDKPGFEMRCFFNENDVSGLEFVKRYGKRENVDILVRPEGAERPPDFHYKIVDDGKIVHLSKHEAGAENREYQTIDYRKLDWVRQIYFNKMILSEYRQNESAFEEFSLS